MESDRGCASSTSRRKAAGRGVPERHASARGCPHVGPAVATPEATMCRGTTLGCPAVGCGVTAPVVLLVADFNSIQCLVTSHPFAMDPADGLYVFLKPPSSSAAVQTLLHMCVCPVLWPAKIRREGVCHTPMLGQCLSAGDPLDFPFEWSV